MTAETPEIFVAGLRGFPDVQGGIEAHCQNLYPRLVRLGCRVTVFTRKPYVDSSRTSYCGVNLAAIDCPKHKFFETIVHTFKAVHAAKRSKARLIHLHGIGPSVAAPLARFYGMKTVFTHHGQDYRRQKWNFFARAFLRLCEAVGVLFSDRVIAVSPFIADEIKRGFGRTAAYIPNGVCVPDPVRSAALLGRYGLEEKKYVLGVGRLVPEKGFHDLLRAFGSERKGWKLVLTGDDPHGGAYSRALHEEARKNPSVVMTGALSGSALREIFQHAGLFAMPSYHEGLPLALLEAMSCGLSCIASDIPANRTVRLADERYFPAGDRERLAEKLNYFIDHPLTETESREQAARIAERFNWDRIAEETLAVYAWTQDHESVGGFSLKG